MYHTHTLSPIMTGYPAFFWKHQQEQIVLETRTRRLLTFYQVITSSRAVFSDTVILIKICMGLFHLTICNYCVSGLKKIEINIRQTDMVNSIKVQNIAIYKTKNYSHYVHKERLNVMSALFQFY